LTQSDIALDTYPPESVGNYWQWPSAPQAGRDPTQQAAVTLAVRYLLPAPIGDCCGTARSSAVTADFFQGFG
jgi:hypothetical protein